MVDTTGLVLLGMKGSTWDVWNDVGDVSYSFCPAFPEYHSGTRVKKLGVLNETKATCSFISSAKVVFIHRDD